MCHCVHDSKNGLLRALNTGKHSFEEESPNESLQANLQGVAEETDIPVLPFNMEEVVGAIHARHRRQVCPNPDTSQLKTISVLLIWTPLEALAMLAFRM